MLNQAERLALRVMLLRRNLTAPQVSALIALPLEETEAALDSLRDRRLLVGRYELPDSWVDRATVALDRP